MRSDAEGVIGRTVGDWLAEPLPRWWHRCRPAISGVLDGLAIERCACGGIRVGFRGKWRERNTRRK